MGQIKKNIVYSTILTFSTYLVPLFVFPYISRVLGPAYIGAIDTVEYIIDFCVLCSMMGLTTFGIREIAKNRDNPVFLRQTFTNLFFLNVVTTIIILLLLGILMVCSSFFAERKTLLFIGGLKVIANLFWIEWFFKGMENFKYITLRSVAIRCLFILSVFLFIHEQVDYILYYVLWVSVYILNAVCNWTYKRKYVKLQFNNISLKHYAKPFFLLGLFAFFSAVYTQLNVPILRLLSGNDSQVAYFTTSVRLYKVIIALFSTLTGVMIPRISILVKERRFAEIHELVGKTFKLLFFFSLPVIVYIEFFAVDVVRIFAGENFDGAVVPMRIAMFMLLIVGTEQIFILQLLIPLRKDKEIVYAAIAGMILCLVVSLFLVKQFQSIGSVIVWMLSELTVLSISSFWVKKYLNVSFPFKMLVNSVFVSVPYVLIGLLSNMLIINSIIKLIVCGVAFVVYALFLEYKFYKLGMVVKLKSKLMVLS
ncbi:MAG: oligosaccharide flippase family protein [Bacteroides sp.]|nr:oligosaccharide flippase family protein [Roseburia sp.]MCM1345476.1 oligosaccharide flippase family protein [Bacteroides sp.]MCM1419986.1 oligosaccharide flippase family protein [Bacteroides sp.]